MELFQINPQDYTVELNKPWILMIPEFKAIIWGDKGSPGDHDGRKKLKARRQLAYIYYMCDFSSPLYEFEFDRKHTEALKFSELVLADITPTVKAAMQVYQTLLYEGSRSLKTLDAIKHGLDGLDRYFKEIDFTKVDNVGRQLHSPKDYVNNVKEINRAYDELDKFRKRVAQELMVAHTIQGRSTLGDKEGNETKRYEEARRPKELEDIKAITYDSIAELIHPYFEEEVSIDEEATENDEPEVGR